MAIPTVFSQVIQLIPRSEFQGWVERHHADKGTRKLDSWTWFGALLFGQLTGHDSIRAIERVFAYNDPKMKALGFGPVRRSTLADANQVRSLAILEEAFQYCLARASSLAPSENGFRFKGHVFALDSTTIELCLKLCPWARFHHEKTGKGAVKLHTAIDIAGDLPQFTVITDGRVHDIRAARESIHFRPNDTVVMDRGYVDYASMNDLNQGGVTFVTRAKSNCRFKVIECRKTDRTRGYMADQTIALKSLRGKDYDGYLRRVSYRDPDFRCFARHFECAGIRLQNPSEEGCVIASKPGNILETRRQCSPQKLEVQRLRRPIWHPFHEFIQPASLIKRHRDCGKNQQERHGVSQVEPFAQDQSRKANEDYECDALLKNLELISGHRAIAQAVRWHLKRILKKRNAPTG